jgi:hypothetical protein
MRVDVSVHNYGFHKIKELGLICNHDGFEKKSKNWVWYVTMMVFKKYQKFGSGM